jgi:hypothetical protein
MLSGFLHIKAERRTLMKLSPGVNFTNILRAAFTQEDSKSAKDIDVLTVFFAILRSASVKVVRKHFVHPSFI